MARKRRQHRREFKFRLALEAAKELTIVNEIASRYYVHPNQVSSWKQQLLAEGQKGRRFFSWSAVLPDPLMLADSSRRM